MCGRRLIDKSFLTLMQYVTSLTPIWRIASTMFWPCETRTSTCRSFATISSGLYRFLAIAVLPCAFTWHDPGITLFVAKVRWKLRRSHRDPYQHLAEVLALEHANKRRRRFFQPVDNIFAIFEATSSHPLTHIAQKVWLFRSKIGNNEPTQEKALAQH